MERSQLATALILVVAAISGFVYTLAVDNEPLLGLDLQGGVSLVLQPTEPVQEEESLDQAVEVIRNRVDGLGVAEPEISRQGDTIVVDLPGVDQQQRALELVGQTAELRFRPVLLGPEVLGVGPVTLDPTLDPDAVDQGEGDDDGDEEGSAGPIRRRQDTSTTAGDDDTTTTTGGDDDDTTTTTGGDDDTTTTQPLSATEQAVLENCTGDLTEPEDDDADAVVLLEGSAGERYCLGPTLVTGDAVETASRGADQFNRPQVNITFRSGPDGIDSFNAAAVICANPFEGDNAEICPASIDPTTGSPGPGRLAIVLDQEVVSAPTINLAPGETFGRTGTRITGDFSVDEADDLALVLRFGALPVELEPQQVQTVSATIGDDVLRSGVIAGLLGLALVAVYLIFYYRLAGLVAILGLVISGLLLWTVIAWFGTEQGLAITLAGIVGLIVSIGVSADSNIVYFENVKDVVSTGRRVSTAIERAYRSSISTIIKADVVSLIAAGLLYFLTVGAVRGFAFYLGLATLLDLAVALLFMRPALLWFASLPAVKKNPRLLGMPVEKGGRS